jgi:hypothetical protein
MKKLCLVLAVLMVATPAWAVVNITCSQVSGTKMVDVSYQVVSEPNKVRGFGLDITVDSGAKIIDVNSYPVYPTNYVGKYWVYPGGIVISGGQVTDPNKPVALSTDPGALGGIDTNGITIEMGSLYYPTGDNSANAPPLTGTLLRFKVDKACGVTITENAVRGGVVLTNPTLNPNVDSPGANGKPKFQVTDVVIQDCLIGGYADGTVPGSEKAAWIAWGKPKCWCYGRQCRGDINGLKTGPNWVQLLDLQLLAAAYNKTDTQLAAIPNGICADVNHKKTGPNRVQLLDLQELAKYYNKAETLVPKCDVAPLTTGPYNYITTP